MNLKQVALKIDSEDAKDLEIDVKGPAEVTAADIQGDGDVTILNSDLHIATVSDGAELHVKMTADKGRGYSSADDNKTRMEGLAIGVLPIDSIYTPIERVNYTVENTRVGQSNDYDKLTLDVWTNGSLTPTEAISLAAKILTEHLTMFVNLTEEAQVTQVMVEREESHQEKDLTRPSKNLTCLYVHTTV